MKIGKVTDLLNSLSKQQEQKSPAITAKNSPPIRLVPSEAAHVSADFGTGAGERSQKVAELKERYNNGELNYNSKDVAKAVFRDLLV